MAHGLRFRVLGFGFGGFLISETPKYPVSKEYALEYDRSPDKEVSSSIKGCWSPWFANGTRLKI